MPENQLTFEEVNKHFESVDLTQFKKDGRNFFSPNDVAKAPGDVLQKICTIYKVVRPFLEFILKFPIPSKWKEAIKTFMDLMDGLCP
jgi:hypothetical protein